jgi:hypothetical protein
VPNKRGQESSGGGAAALVAIITLLIILYVLFIPPSEREKILGVNETAEEAEEDGGTTGGAEYNKTLLSVQPGKINYVPLDEIEHELPSVNLYTKTEGMVIKEAGSVAVKKALFTEKKQNITFKLDYPEQTKNILLSFNMQRNYGEIIIKLNGQEIFNGEIVGSMPNPIKLPSDMLKVMNTIEFEAAGIGLVFWKVNDIALTDVKITGDITDMGASESRSIFLINKNEKDNLNTASISFYAGCDMDSVGRLFVEINGYDIFTGIPDCGQIRTYQISPERLLHGENIIRFRTEKGHYLMDRIAVKTELTEPEQYVWFFQLSNDEYNSVLNGSIDLNMTAEFVDDSYKEGYFVINGYENGFGSKKTEESWIIDPYVKKGGNTIRLDPSNNMYITELTVVTE